MLKGISWGECIEATLMMASIYYGVIVALYYRKEIWRVLKGRRPGKPGGNEKSGPILPAPALAGTIPQDFVLTEKIVSELKRVIKKVMDDHVEREDMMRSIAHVLESHTHLENTPYGIAINHFIIRECETNYSVHLSEDEVGKLWGE
jgi:hypothetical protein